MIVRIAQATIDPEDAPRARQVFLEEVRPTLRSLTDCIEVEMLIGLEEHSGGLLEVVTMSRWSSPEALEAASGSDAYRQATEALRSLFQRAPIVHHFEEVG